MPHAIIEYSDNLTPDVASGHVVDHVHTAMIESGLFQIEAIKTRAFATHDFRVGAKGAQGSFVYISVALLAGRTLEQRKALSDSILAAVKPSLSHADQVTVEIREMDRDTYQKL